MKSSYFKVLVLSGMLLLSACASKRTRPGVPPLIEPRPSDQVSRPVPTDPIHLPPPPDSTSAIPDENAESHSSGVVIVAGGAGVASFGLIGILKRFKEERIKVDGIVATGWPTIVALGNGYLKSIHDVEWLASRLTESDLQGAGSFVDDKKLLDTGRFPKIFERDFGSREINESRTPLVIAAVNTDVGKPDSYDRGGWRYPFGKTMSIPGIYRDAPDDLSDSEMKDLQAIDIREASRRSKVILVLNFYEDFFSAVEQSKRKLAATAFMKSYVKHLKKDFSEQAKEASLVGKVTLNKDFDNLANLRLAIVTGYQEGKRLAKELRPLLSGN